MKEKLIVAIYNAMREKKISQMTLSYMAGIYQSDISAILNRKKRASLQKLIKLARMVGISNIDIENLYSDSM